MEFVDYALLAYMSVILGVNAGVLTYLMHKQSATEDLINALATVADVRATASEMRADRSEDRETQWSRHRDHQKEKP